MKTKILLLSTALCFGLLTLNSGCAKLKAKLFQAFTTGATSVDFTIPVITDTTLKMDWGTFSNYMNIDSLIKAETSGAFSLDDIKSIKVSEMKMVLTNADATDNFANFKQGWGTFHSNTNPTDIAITTGLNPDVFSDTWILPSIADVNLKSYATGTQFSYVIAGHARRATTKILTAKLYVKFLIE